MRGAPDPQLAMLMSLSPEELVPAYHPIRRIRRVVDDVLAELDGQFDAMYSAKGRRSVPPEALLKARRSNRLAAVVDGGLLVRVRFR